MNKTIVLVTEPDQHFETSALVHTLKLASHPCWTVFLQIDKLLNQHRLKVSTKLFDSGVLYQKLHCAFVQQSQKPTEAKQQRWYKYTQTLPVPHEFQVGDVQQARKGNGAEPLLSGQHLHSKVHGIVHISQVVYLIQFCNKMEETT